MERRGEELVSVTIGVSDTGRLVSVTSMVAVARGVDVEISGVWVAPMIAGVAVNTDGVRVGGTIGVGALPGNG